MSKTVAKHHSMVFKISITILIILCFIFSILFLIKKKDSEDKIIGTIDTYPFYREELSMYTEENRAKVAALFSQRYEIASLGTDFWEKEYEGITPHKMLIDISLEELIRDKIIQQEAVSRGIIAPADFLEMKKIVKERNSQKNNGENSLTFGPETYAIAEYNRYLMTQATDDLKKALLTSDLTPNQQQLEQAFDSLPDSLKEHDFSASGYVLTWDDTDDPMAQRVLSELSPNGTIWEISSIFQEKYPHISVESFSLNSQEVHREDTFSLELSMLLFPAKVGDSFSLQRYEEQLLYYVTTKEGGGFLNFDEAPKLGESKWINDQFELYIDGKVAEADIQLSDSLYKINP